MLKHLIVALATCFTLFTTAPVALADNIVNSPNITTNSGSSSQGLTLNKSTAKHANSFGTKAGKAGIRGSNQLAKAGQANANKALKDANTLSTSTSKQAYSVSGSTVNLPGHYTSITQVFSRLKIAINWAGQNVISIIVMFAVFVIVILLLYVLIRLIGSVVGIGKTPTIKLVGAFLGLLLLLFIVPSLGGIFGYGASFYNLLLWVLTGH